MAEFSSYNFTDLQIPSAAQLNTSTRKGSADLQDFFRFLFFGDLDPTAAVFNEGIVVGGLTVAGKAGDMRVDVLAGAGWLFDATVVSPRSTLVLALLQADAISPTLSDGDGANPRIDVISVAPATQTTDNEPVLQKGGGSIGQDIRRGPALTLVVTEGTPAASPVAPSTPSGNIKLAEVLVPTGLTAGGGGTASATITDKRVLNGLMQKGPGTSLAFELRRFAENATAAFEMLTLQTAGGVTPARILTWLGDLAEHWPSYTRIGEPVGDTAVDLFPMMIPGGREYWLPMGPLQSNNDPGANADVFMNGIDAAGTDWEGVSVLHTTGVAVTVRRTMWCNVDQARALQVIDAFVNHEVNTALGGTGSITARLFHWDRATDTLTAISDAQALTASVGVFNTQLANVVATTVAEGDIIATQWTFVFDGVADSADVDVHGGRVKIREGRN
jgi:hypothetical protein